MIVKTTVLRDNMAKYVKEVIETNVPLQVTSSYGDFYIVSLTQFESHKAYQMLTAELCESKIQELIKTR